MANLLYFILMNRIAKIYPYVKLIFIIGIALPNISNGVRKSEIRRPNIIIVISDDHPYQIISAYGSAIAKTPQIDRIAKEGAIFQHAYVTNSICGPSRAVFLTGKYSHKNGFKDNDFSRFDSSQQTFMKLLGQSGYQTAWIGKWHLVSNPRGFDYWTVLPDQGRYYNPEFISMDGSKYVAGGYATNVIEDYAEKWIGQRDQSKPFCLVIGHKAPHRTWIPDTLDLGLYDSHQFALPSNFYDDYTNRKVAQKNNLTIDKTIQLDYDLKVNTKEFDKDFYTDKQRERLKKYYKSVSDEFNAKNLSGKELIEWKYQRYMVDFLNTSHSIDRNMGRLLDYLDAHHLAENTLVIYMSDQGAYLGEHGWIDKRWMYEESFRTPMLMRYPGKIKPGTSYGQMILNLDLAPTLLEVSGVAVPEDMQGESMVKLFDDKKKILHDAVYYHYYEPNHKVPPHLGIKTDRYKLIYFYDQLNSWEFYDIENDPQEMKNGINDKKNARIIEQMKKRLLKLIDEYDDQEAKVKLKGGL